MVILRSVQAEINTPLLRLLQYIEKNRGIPVTGRGEVHSVVRRRGSHILWTIGSQMEQLYAPAVLYPQENSRD
jgi:hypothetical protein